MIIWLNGAFGAGKTTTARALVERLPEARLFDSETVGLMLSHVLDWQQVTDFQQWPPWRQLVVDTARRLLDHTGGTLVIPQTVLVEEYWRELRAGFAEAGLPVRPFLLHTDAETLTGRIRTDVAPASATAGAWRLEHVAPYQEALPWLRTEFEVVDTTTPSPAEVADLLLATLGRSGAGVAMSDAEIEAATVGAPRQLNGPVRLVPYDPAWPGVFAAEAEGIHRRLAGLAHRLEHTGSTSVPGLTAKPIIDMLLVVPESADEASYVPALEPLGYRVVIREPDWHEHRVLRKTDPAPGVDGVNLHVLSAGSPEIRRVLGFRDRLRAHDAERDLYAETKRALAGRSWKYTQNYADAKSEVVEAILARALGD